MAQGHLIPNEENMEAAAPSWLERGHEQRERLKAECGETRRTSTSLCGAVPCRAVARREKTEGRRAEDGLISACVFCGEEI